MGHYPWGYLLEGSATLDSWRHYALFRGPRARPNSSPYRDQVAARLAAVEAAAGQSAESTHFYDEMWARRVHSEAYYDNGLELGLASRRGTVFDAERDEGIDPAELSDYGVVRLVKVPNVIAAPFPWPDSGIARVDAKIAAKEMILSVNGNLIGLRTHDLSIAEIRALSAPTIGRGVYGESEAQIDRVNAAGASRCLSSNRPDPPPSARFRRYPVLVFVESAWK